MPRYFSSDTCSISHLMFNDSVAGDFVIEKHGKKRHQAKLTLSRSFLITFLGFPHNSYRYIDDREDLHQDTLLEDH